jgi:hypothetical protein
MHEKRCGLLRLGCSKYLLILSMAGFSLHANTVLTENFDSILTLPGSGWVMTNNSAAAGTTAWFQGNPAVFTSQAGAADSYIAANFNNAAFGGDISNWLITPMLSLLNGMQITFYTRTEPDPVAADALEVRMSPNGASSNVGATATSVGDFATVLLSINPTLLLNGYPQAWTQFTATVSGLGGPTNGRLAFRYVVPDTSVNADYIGIDTVSVNDGLSVAPEPATAGLFLLGIAAVLGRAARIRRRGKT